MLLTISLIHSKVLLENIQGAFTTKYIYKRQLLLKLSLIKYEIV